MASWYCQKNNLLFYTHIDGLWVYPQWNFSLLQCLKLSPPQCSHFCGFSFFFPQSNKKLFSFSLSLLWQLSWPPRWLRKLLNGFQTQIQKNLNKMRINQFVWSFFSSPQLSTCDENQISETSVQECNSNLNKQVDQYRSKVCSYIWIFWLFSNQVYLTQMVEWQSVK